MWGGIGDNMNNQPSRSREWAGNILVIRRRRRSGGGRATVGNTKLSSSLGQAGGKRKIIMKRGRRRSAEGPTYSAASANDMIGGGRAGTDRLSATLGKTTRFGTAPRRASTS